MNKTLKEILMMYICLVVFTLTIIILSWATAQWDMLIIGTLTLTIATLGYIGVDNYFDSFED